MWIKTLLLSAVLAVGAVAVPASADDGVRITVHKVGVSHRGYDASYAAHRYRHYVRPYMGYLWTHQLYLRPYGHAYGWRADRRRADRRADRRWHRDRYRDHRRDRDDRDGPRRRVHDHDG
jgi:hypothetical protein